MSETTKLFLSEEHLQEKLSAAIENLYYSSESDYPFQIRVLPELENLTSQGIIDYFNLPDTTTISEETVAEFFRNAMREEKWMDIEEKVTAKRFQQLYQLLLNQLTNLHVFRIGEIEIDIYILGFLQNEVVMGLQTKAIET